MLTDWRPTQADIELLRAISDDDFDAARLALQRGASIYARDSHGRTPVLRAALSNASQILIDLLDRGAPVSDTAPDSGMNTFLAAAGSVDARTLQRILSVSRELVHSTTSHGNTAVMCAMQAEKIENVRFLISRYPILAGIPNNTGDTPLLLAAEQGHAGLVQELLNIRCSPSEQNNEKWDPLMKASYAGHNKVLKVLLASGVPVDRQNYRGWSALCYAVYTGNHDGVALLLAHHAPVCVQTKAGTTPLMMAAFSLDIRMMHRLLDALPEAQAPAYINQLVRGESVLTLFIRKARESLQQNGQVIGEEEDYQEICRRLITLGANPQATADALGMRLEDVQAGDAFAGAREAVDLHPAHSQTTHRAIVHRTAARAGRILQRRYPQVKMPEDLQKILVEIQACRQRSPALEGLAVWLEQLPGKYEQDNVPWRDPATGLSLLEALALVWMGIHDEKRGVGDARYAYARQALATAGRLAWREYAPQSQDDGEFSQEALDRGEYASCPDGCFNELMEVASRLELPSICVLRGPADVTLYRQGLRVALSPVEALNFAPNRGEILNSEEAHTDFITPIRLRQLRFLEEQENAMVFEGEGDGDGVYGWEWFPSGECQAFIDQAAMSFDAFRASLVPQQLPDAPPPVSDAQRFEQQMLEAFDSAQYEGMLSAIMQYIQAPAPWADAPWGEDARETIRQLAVLVHLTLDEQMEYVHQLRRLEAFSVSFKAKLSPDQADMIEMAVFEIIRGKMVEQALVRGQARAGMSVRLAQRLQALETEQAPLGAEGVLLLSGGQMLPGYEQGPHKKKRRLSEGECIGGRAAPRRSRSEEFKPH